MEVWQIGRAPSQALRTTRRLLRTVLLQRGHEWLSEYNNLLKRPLLHLLDGPQVVAHFLSPVLCGEI